MNNEFLIIHYYIQFVTDLSKNVNKRVSGFDPVVFRALHPTHLIKIYDPFSTRFSFFFLSKLLFSFVSYHEQASGDSSDCNLSTFFMSSGLRGDFPVNYK